MIMFFVLFYKDIDKSCYSSDGKSLSKVNDASPDLIISSTCEIIQDKCFYQLKTLFSFSFQENPNLTTIGEKSFSHCTNLTIINLSSCAKLTKISSYAFSGCYKVNQILLPEGLLEIEGGAFGDNHQVTSIIIPASVKIIGIWAFNGCSKLQNVTFEEGSNLTSLEWYVFGYTAITSFQIPEKVSYLNGQAFEDGKLINFTVHPNNNYLTVKDYVIYSKDKSILFFICNKTGYEIPNSVTTIGTYCFSYSTIETLIIPENVKRIEDYAFYGCDSLINVTFLGQIDYFGSWVFSSCENLELIIFPNSPMTVGGSWFVTKFSPKVNLSFTCKTLFYNSQYISSIQRNTNVSISYLNEPNLIITPNCLIMNSDQTIIYEYWGYIPSYSFISITIPKSVKKIKEKAFENSIIYNFYFTKDSQITEIENDAFRNCSNLRSFNYSFPKLQALGMSSFKDCINLESFTFSSPNLTVMSNAFENCRYLKKVSNIRNIPDNCFCGCTKLVEVTIREGSESIGYKSFENCSSLLCIKIPQSFKIISKYSFLYCKKLKSIIFSETNSLDTFSINSISECESLTNISNFSSEKYKCIDNTLYYKNNNKWELIFHLSSSKDKELNISCDVICSYSFNSSNNIEKINITSESVSVIEKHSFYNCLNLKYINFPLSVSDVEIDAFHDCKSIRCPLIIENTSTDYLQMIVSSGIPERLMISCHIAHVSNNLLNHKSLRYPSAHLFWKHLTK
ncbi:surface antigen BspA-like [Trichomonas vaginalis G3]|uniref:Surface antigen BspA-like n=1 Tax=Trichomonas vaginalis (strain ATCC PRA-98 / G3) TaxID=412133 RepID=A2EAL5_TRIV3|nr:ribonuclease inhibitor domain-containing protein [Trichomonas vaginalis G3]EAY10326.1 surface antigen BspA-like [Trichomonas vaginalis G3]KAI5491043.1 ribonuclease inhibitor domain-containing protein [Trichomonas vaginalis G3]|eukprot:XP_001322549.1 surface antigen BspA-like [Trichomonas vaginalis G3]